MRPRNLDDFIANSVAPDQTGIEIPWPKRHKTQFLITWFLKCDLNVSKDNCV
ncbi:hypothetical protein DPMN_026653 [Dreissena polymorpha]|uniref:Uncharacterized protein n=1 Tax=Dreissena polymorpha TaxID=45954 RepID=A0A9D4LTU1_DREPO|nr:hypothetical protein DPMN_026653 [Dreissena polymorpha]